jgi:hypothetical protein
MVGGFLRHNHLHLLPLWSLNPPIPVLQPHNIIFSQIRPGLDLYELQGDGSGVFQGMDLAYRDIRGLIFSDQKRLLSVGDVFRPVPGFEFFYNGLDILGLVLGVRFFGSFRCI